MENGLVGQRLQEVPLPLKPSLDKAWSNKKPGIVLISIGLRLGDVRAQQAALDLVSDEKRPESERIKLIEILGETGQAQAVLEQHGQDRVALAPVERAHVLDMRIVRPGRDGRASDV